MFHIFNIIANTIIEPGMSGGNRIFIEISKKWVNKGVKVQVFTSNVGKKLCISNGLENTRFETWNLAHEKEKFSSFEIIKLYILALIMGSIKAIKYNPTEKEEIIYSSSDYWPDTIPAIILKLKNRDLIWVAGFFLFAPPPWQKDSPYKGKRLLLGFFFWLTQSPIYWLVKKYADMVFVTSEPDVKKFTTAKRGKNKIFVIMGGVDTKLSAMVVTPKRKKYDAVFIGRFHPQKGVLELIDIWEIVIAKKPEAKLVMIGDGPLKKELKSKIKEKKLEKNIKLLGFLDGIPKMKIFKSAKIIVHPAIYDSGGMAACEAMSAGLPGVSFNLEALETYYPKGMIKTPRYDFEKFAENILELLENKNLYNKISEEAFSWSKKWDWNKRAEKILSCVQKKHNL